MDKRIVFSTCLCAVALAGFAQKSVTVSVTNPTQDKWVDAPVVFAWKDAMPGKGQKLITAKAKETLPVQVDDFDGDGTPDELVMLVSLDPGQTKSFELSDSAPKGKVESRAHTGMFLKTATVKGMEGPGWESDRIAFRLYWDERNPIDIFCKTQQILSLDALASSKVNYHVQSKWGQDVLKVGTALGCGGFGAFIDGKVEKASYAKRDYKVVADGPLRAAIDLKYNDWETSSRKLNLIARMNIFGGQDWGESQLTMTSADGKPIPEFVTAVVKHPETTYVEDAGAGVLGRWGNQALGNNEVPKSGNLGLGVVVPSGRIAAIGDDGVNSYVRLTPGEGKVSWRYNANWWKQPDAVKDAEQYKARLLQISRLQPQVKVEVK